MEVSLTLNTLLVVVLHGINDSVVITNRNSPNRFAWWKNRKLHWQLIWIQGLINLFWWNEQQIYEPKYEKMKLPTSKCNASIATIKSVNFAILTPKSTKVSRGVATKREYTNNLTISLTQFQNLTEHNQTSPVC